MSTPTRIPEASAPSSATPIPRRRPLPPWFTPSAFGVLTAVAVILELVTDLNVVVMVLLAAVIGTIVVVATTGAVEGPRKATDRFVTCLVHGAFLLAMVPLVSLVYQVVDRGLARLDGEFFNSSMLGVIGPGGGAYHAIIGTLIITGI